LSSEDDVLHRRFVRMTIDDHCNALKHMWIATVKLVIRLKDTKTLLDKIFDDWDVNAGIRELQSSESSTLIKLGFLPDFFSRGFELEIVHKRASLTSSKESMKLHWQTVNNGTGDDAVISCMRVWMAKRQR
jgi:hypothetical protein